VGKYRIPVDVAMTKFALEHYQLRMLEDSQ
jgi:hypothetical protein